MATYYGNEWQDAFVDVPTSKIAPADDKGHVYHKRFSYTLPSIAPTTSDIIKLVKIPKGARVLDVVFSHPDMGSAGDLDIGWAASAELDSSGSAVVAASADGFFADADVNAAAGIKRMSAVSGAAAAGFLKKFDAEVDMQIAIPEAWTATSGEIVGYVLLSHV